jgi:hypothetical protein
MIPMSWAGILGIFVGLFYLIASGDETKIQVLIEAIQDLRWGGETRNISADVARRSRASRDEATTGEGPLRR